MSRMLLAGLALAIAGCQNTSATAGASNTTFNNINAVTMVSSRPTAAPIINALDYSPKGAVGKDQVLTLNALATDAQGLPLEITWSATRGRLSANKGQIVTWQPLDAGGVAGEGEAFVTAVVSNGYAATSGVVSLAIAADGTATMTEAPAINVEPPPEALPAGVAAAGSAPSRRTPTRPADGGNPSAAGPTRASTPRVTPPPVPGELDAEVALPGGVPQTSTLGPQQVGERTFSVQLGQGFVPSRDGAVSAFAASISAGDDDVGPDTSVTIFGVDERGVPAGAPLGQAVIPGARIQRFGLNNPYTPAVFEPPVPVKGGQTYVAVLACDGGRVSWLLSDKKPAGGPLRISFAEVGNDHWLWDLLPENKGFETGVHRVYLAK